MVKSKPATAQPLADHDDEFIDRPDAAIELFGAKSEKYGVRYLEKDAAGARRIPYYKLQGTRAVRYKRAELRAIREAARITAESA